MEHVTQIVRVRAVGVRVVARTVQTVATVLALTVVKVDVKVVAAVVKVDVRVARLLVVQGAPLVRAV